MEDRHEETLTFWQVMTSVVASAFGVQKRATMERDFTHGEIGKFIAVGALFTFIFVATLIAIVSLVVSNS